MILAKGSNRQFNISATPAKRNGRQVGRMSGQHHFTLVVAESEAIPDESMQSPERITRRVAMVGSVALVSLGVVAEPSQALGKSAKELAREAKIRRQKLKETAEKMRSAGKASDAFESSSYSVPEEATTPNVVNRNRNVE